MQNKIHERLVLTATKIAESGGATAEVKITRETPVTYNDPALTQKMTPSLQRTAGASNTIVINAITGAEDFAYYSQVTNACFYRLGTGNKEKDTMHSVHTPKFDIDEDALKISTGLMAYITLKQLGN